MSFEKAQEQLKAHAIIEATNWRGILCGCNACEIAKTVLREVLFIDRRPVEGPTATDSPWCRCFDKHCPNHLLD